MKCMDLYPHDEILGIYKVAEESQKLHADTKLLEYVSILFGQVGDRLQQQKFNVIPYEIKINSPSINIGDIFEFCKSEKYRREWVEMGRVLAKNHIEKWTDCSESELL